MDTNLKLLLASNNHLVSEVEFLLFSLNFEGSRLLLKQNVSSQFENNECKNAQKKKALEIWLNMNNTNQKSN